MKSKRLMLLAFLLSLAAPIIGRAEMPIRRIPLPGDGSWDYITVDTAARRLYVTHTSRVHVLDLDREVVVGEIGGLSGVHGVALAHEFGYGFTSNGGDATVTVFDLKTLAPVRTLKVDGKKPDAILYEPFTKRVFTFNGDSDSSCAFDAASGRPLGTIKLGGAPEFAASDGAGRAFVNLEDKGEVACFDPRTLKVTARWPLAPAHTPTSLALDVANRRLFSACRSKNLIVLNSDSGARVANLPIGGGVDALTLDLDHQRAFVSNGDGTVNVITWTDANHYRVAQTLTTQPGAKTLGYDPKTQRLFLSGGKLGPVPPATPEQPKPRARLLPGSFELLVLDVPAVD